MDFQMLNAAKLAETPDVTGRTRHNVAGADSYLATLDSAINTAARLEYLISLEADSADAILASLDNATDERAMAEHMARLADAADLADTYASVRADMYGA